VRFWKKTLALKFSKVHSKSFIASLIDVLVLKCLTWNRGLFTSQKKFSFLQTVTTAQIVPIFARTSFQHLA